MMKAADAVGRRYRAGNGAGKGVRLAGRREGRLPEAAGAGKKTAAGNRSRKTACFQPETLTAASQAVPQ